MTSAPRSSWTRMEVSGERKWREPSRWLRKVTPSSAMRTSELAALLPRALEAVDLEAARVGEHGPAPGHEAVEPAQPPDPLVARAEVQVVGVPEDDPRAQLDEVPRREGLHAPRRAHRHEDRGLEHAARRLETPAAGGAVLGQELEADHGPVSPGRAVVSRGASRRAGQTLRTLARAVSSTRARHARPPRPSETMRTPKARSTGAPRRSSRPPPRRWARGSRSRSAARGALPGGRLAAGQAMEQPPSDSVMVRASTRVPSNGDDHGPLHGEAGRADPERDRLPAAPTAARYRAAGTLARSRWISTPGGSDGRPMRRTMATLP